MPSALIRNIGVLISGDIADPILDADAVFIVDGKIRLLGKAAEMGPLDADVIVDTAGATIAPGLIDSHCHPVLGDYSPRQMQIGFLDSEVHGGVTTIISAGEVHLPGRPKDPAGAKALAILAAKSFADFRPCGAKVIGGAVILEKGLKEQDFEEMAREGVRIVGEIGLGSVKSPEDAAPMVAWAKKNGMVVMMHTGGTSIPGSAAVTADQVIAVGPDIASHVNGGPTSLSVDEIARLVKETPFALELVHCGNPRTLVEAIKLGVEHKALGRFIIGNDAPSGTGVVPLGILRVICMVSSLAGVKPEQAMCMAAGNTARVFRLDAGFVREGMAADLIAMDAPIGSVGKTALAAIEAGDIPGVSMVMIDGKVQVKVSRNTPPAVRKSVVVT
jgi:enamidase